MRMASRRNKKNCKTKRRTYKKGGKHESRRDSDAEAKKIHEYKNRLRSRSPSRPSSRSRPPTGEVQGQEYNEILSLLRMQRTTRSR